MCHPLPAINLPTEDEILQALHDLGGHASPAALAMQTGRQDLVKSAEFRALLADLCAWGILVSDGAKYRFGPFSFRLATAVA